MNLLEPSLGVMQLDAGQSYLLKTQNSPSQLQERRRQSSKREPSIALIEGNF